MASTLRATRRLATIIARASRRGEWTRHQHYSTKNSSYSAPGISSVSSWSSSRVLLLAAVVGGSAFAGGIAYNKSNNSNIDYARETKFTAPKYANLKDMQIVRTSQIIFIASHILNHVIRPSMRSASLLEKTVLASMTRISSCMATQSGRRQTLTLFPLPLSTPNLLRRCLVL
jgi:hypothetical protein